MKKKKPNNFKPRCNKVILVKFGNDISISSRAAKGLQNDRLYMNNDCTIKMDYR